MREILHSLFKDKDYIDENSAREILGEKYGRILDELLKTGLIRMDRDVNCWEYDPRVYYFLTEKGKSLMNDDKSSR